MQTLASRPGAASPSGSGAAKSMIATVGRSRAADESGDPGTPRFGYRPRRVYTPSTRRLRRHRNTSSRSTAAPGPPAWRASSTGSGRSAARPAAPGRGQQLERVEVEDLLRVAGERRQEHVVAALGALDDHRRDHRHQDAEERLAAVPVPAVLPVESPDPVRRGGRRGIRARAPARARAGPRRDSEPPRKYDDVGHHRAPADRLPVDDHELPRRLGSPNSMLSRR